MLSLLILDFTSGSTVDWVYATQNVSLAYTIEFRDQGNDISHVFTSCILKPNSRFRFSRPLRFRFASRSNYSQRRRDAGRSDRYGQRSPSAKCTVKIVFNNKCSIIEYVFV